MSNIIPNYLISLSASRASIASPVRQRFKSRITFGADALAELRLARSEQKRRELLPATQAKVLLRITFDPFLSDEIANIVPKILAAVGHEL